MAVSRAREVQRFRYQNHRFERMPGMGMLFIQAVTFLDIPVMAAYLCIISFIFVVLNTLVDIAYAVIDPRLRTAR